MLLPWVRQFGKSGKLTSSKPFSFFVKIAVKRYCIHAASLIFFAGRTGGALAGGFYLCLFAKRNKYSKNVELYSKLMHVVIN